MSFTTDGSLLAIGSIYPKKAVREISIRIFLGKLYKTIDTTDGVKALLYTLEEDCMAVVRNAGSLSLGVIDVAS